MHLLEACGSCSQWFSPEQCPCCLSSTTASHVSRYPRMHELVAVCKVHPSLHAFPKTFRALSLLQDACSFSSWTSQDPKGLRESGLAQEMKPCTSSRRRYTECHPNSSPLSHHLSFWLTRPLELQPRLQFSGFVCLFWGCLFVCCGFLACSVSFCNLDRNSLFTSIR